MRDYFSYLYNLLAMYQVKPLNGFTYERVQLKLRLLATSFPGLFSAHPLLGGEKPWEQGWFVRLELRLN